jgi:hypothetical protein
MTNYRNNHYVPIWYQKRFLSHLEKDRKFYYLDLSPQAMTSNGRTYARNAVKRWGPPSCFAQRDLYTTQFRDVLSSEIEERFFGPLDDSAQPAIDYIADFQHPSADRDLLWRFIRYLSLQKLRTPKGLKYLSQFTQTTSKNLLLQRLQQLQDMYVALWTEAVWVIADSSQSGRELLLSDHPVTAYNSGYFPGARECRDGGDPHIWKSGTHTLFPLSPTKLLILTNLSWVRHPYGNPKRDRPNPDPFRQAIFKFTDIQTHRILSSDDVVKINYIIKKRAYRYIAANNRDTLYPELNLPKVQWDSFGKEYLLMPDPRAVPFSSQIVWGFADGSSDSVDAYGRRPGQTQFADKIRERREIETFHAFKGEYARLFGPQRRGRIYSLGTSEVTCDSAELHKSYLDGERTNRKHRYKT